MSKINNIKEESKSGHIPKNSQKNKRIKKKVN